jgi:hypothetical protein
MHIEKSIKIGGPKHGRCMCINDYIVVNTDITYRKGLSYFCEYYHKGSYGPYYKVYLNDTSACNINGKLFNINFKLIKNEKSIKRASKTS